jgi:hypothetical protein
MMCAARHSLATKVERREIADQRAQIAIDEMCTKVRKGMQEQRKDEVKGDARR